MLEEVWPYLVGGGVVVIALSASVHAVLTKRSVSAAVAWVGLIWLSPGIGALLYGLLGINRVYRRASARRESGDRYQETWRLAPGPGHELVSALGREYEHLVSLARLGDRVAERPLLPGNRVTPLVNGDEAFPAMLRAIESAQHSVSLASYIFDNDRAGHAFVEALQRAVQRGIQVRVLVDDVGARYSFPPTVRTLRRLGVPTGRFMPAVLHWRMPYFNLRNHRKILVIDGRVGFTGGMNIREGNCLRMRPSHPIQDLHFRIDGPVVAEMQEVFAEDWAFSTGEHLSGHAWFPPLEGAGDTLVRGISDGPDIDFEKLPTMILGALAAARDRVLLMTPYFIPDPALNGALTLAAMRGVDVRILLPEKNNLVLVQWASTAYWRDLLEKGCRIFLAPPPFDHSKLLLVDGVWTLLGSANLDPRSLQLNFEFNLECYGADLAGSIEALYREKLDQAREVTLHGIRSRPAPLVLRDNLARLLSPYL